ncbi:MAG TPA: DUF3014 domain-containing protein [Burkholderiales bacterium]|jgi:hypothetical protein|nr:DUF3014 domain-containing protein [Burkholderiales bacterium]
MEQWSARDDRPSYFRSEERSYTWLVVVLAIALIAGLAAAYYWYASRHLSPLGLPGETASAPAAPEPASPPAPEPSPEPEIRHPIAAPKPAKPLPTLDNSDPMTRESLVGLIGRKAFDELVIPKELIRRTVATIDNLPRDTAPRRMVPLDPVPGRFRIAGSGDKASLDAGNFKRYAAYVRVMQVVDSRALVAAYVRAYPLFQRAYEELGFPGKHFNDRLMEAIDDLLAAPEVDAPIKLVQPRVLYEFADPDLETRSAGQKILIRMGPANASKVKAKLREIRRELIAASERRQ